MQATLTRAHRASIGVRHRIPAGMGDWKSAIAGAIANDELWMLMKGVRQLSDQLTNAINDRNGIVAEYQRSKKLLAEAQKLGGPVTIQTPLGFVPNPATFPAVSAFATAKKSVQVFARQIQTFTMMDRIFSEISAVLTRSGLVNEANAVDQTLRQIRRFTIETDNIMTPMAPTYYATKQAILRKAETKWRATGVGKSGWGNPRWLALYIQAADEVIPVKQRPRMPGQMLDAGMGNPLATLIVALLWVVGIIAAALVMNATLKRLTGDQNAKAEGSIQLLRDYAEQKRIEALQMRRMGKSEAEIVARMKSIDKEADSAVGSIPDAPSAFGGAITIIAVLAGATAAAKIGGVI